MKCDTNTMIKAGLGLGVLLALAYVALPAAHAFILASAPLLLVLLCPLSMIFMMKSMNSCHKENDKNTGEDKAHVSKQNGRWPDDFFKGSAE